MWESAATDPAITTVASHVVILPNFRQQCACGGGLWGRRNCRGSEYLFHIISDRLCPCITPYFSFAFLSAKFNTLRVNTAFCGVGGDGDGDLL